MAEMERLVPEAPEKEGDDVHVAAAADISIEIPQPQLLPVNTTQTPPATLNKHWDELSPDELVLADSLGFDETTWVVDEQPTSTTLSRENSSLSNLLRVMSSSSSNSAAPNRATLSRGSSFGALVRNRSAALAVSYGTASSRQSSRRSSVDVVKRAENANLEEEMRSFMLKTAPALSVEDADEIVRNIFHQSTDEATQQLGEEINVLVHMPRDCEHFHLSVRITLCRTFDEFMRKVEKECHIPPAEQVYTRDIYGHEPIAACCGSTLAELGICCDDLLYLKRGFGGSTRGLSPVTESPRSRSQQQKQHKLSHAEQRTWPTSNRSSSTTTSDAVDEPEPESVTKAGVNPQRHDLPSLDQSQLDTMNTKQLVSWVAEIGLTDLAHDLECHGLTGRQCFAEMQAQADWSWQDLHAFLCSLGVQPSSAAAIKLHAAVQEILCTDRGMMLLALATHAFGETVEVVFPDGKLGLTLAAMPGIDVPGPTRIATIDPNGAAAQHQQLRPGMILIGTQGRSLAGRTHAQALKAVKAESRPITLTFLANTIDGADDDALRGSRDIVAARRFAAAALKELEMVAVKDTVAPRLNWVKEVVLELLCMLAAIDFEQADYATCIANATAALLQQQDCTTALRWRGLAAVRSRQWTLARQDWRTLATTGVDSHFAMAQLDVIENSLDSRSKSNADADHEQRLLGAVRKTTTRLETSMKKLRAAEEQIKAQQQEMKQSMITAAMTKRQKQVAEQLKMKARADVERQQMEILTLRKQLECLKLEANPEPVYPEEWELSDHDKNLELKDVMYGSREWDKVSSRFETAVFAGLTIARVQRIQNRYLWRYFLYEKSRMRELKPDLPGFRDITTKKLWHGTGATEPRDIYMGQEGFDVRYSRPGLWGRGIYFAESAAYSASGYSHLSIGHGNHNRGCIILAEVLVGDSYQCPPSTYLP